MQERIRHETAVLLSTTVPRFEQYAGVGLLLLPTASFLPAYTGSCQGVP